MADELPIFASDDDGDSSRGSGERPIFAEDDDRPEVAVPAAPAPPAAAVRRRRRQPPTSGRVGVLLLHDHLYEPASSSSAGVCLLAAPAEQRRVVGLGLLCWEFHPADVRDGAGAGDGDDVGVRAGQTGRKPPWGRRG